MYTNHHDLCSGRLKAPAVSQKCFGSQRQIGAGLLVSFVRGTTVPKDSALLTCTVTYCSLCCIFSLPAPHSMFSLLVCLQHESLTSLPTDMKLHSSHVCQLHLAAGVDCTTPGSNTRGLHHRVKTDTFVQGLRREYDTRHRHGRQAGSTITSQTGPMQEAGGQDQHSASSSNRHEVQYCYHGRIQLHQDNQMDRGMQQHQLPAAMPGSNHAGDDAEHDSQSEHTASGQNPQTQASDTVAQVRCDPACLA